MKPADTMQVYPITGTEVIVWRGHTLGVLFPDRASDRFHWVTWATTCRTGTGMNREAALIAAVESLAILNPETDCPAEEFCEEVGHDWSDGFILPGRITKYTCKRCGAHRIDDPEGTGMP